MKQIDEWGDIKVGDSVKVVGWYAPPGSLVVVELHAHDGLGPDGGITTALVRDAEGTVRELSAATLSKID